jgi:peptide/nickel transport system substrate-binding protein
VVPAINATDPLVEAAATETDPARRTAMLQDAWRIVHEAVGFVPLHQQHMAWGVRDTLEVAQRPDDQLVWRSARKH